jgi:hypothetical protein
VNPDGPHVGYFNPDERALDTKHGDLLVRDDEGRQRSLPFWIAMGQIGGYLLLSSRCLERRPGRVD